MLVVGGVHGKQQHPNRIKDRFDNWIVIVIVNASAAVDPELERGSKIARSRAHH